LHLFFWVVLSFLLIGCGAEEKAQNAREDTMGGPGETGAAGSVVAEMPTAQTSNLTARKLYDEFCASCHDSGEGGAPVTGKPSDWQTKSPLWQAVLTEHAKAGYLDMPARGGNADLPDLAVSQALEYMLLETFPEKLPD
jgi:cytochrome c5